MSEFFCWPPDVTQPDAIAGQAQTFSETFFGDQLKREKFTNEKPKKSGVFKLKTFFRKSTFNGQRPFCLGLSIYEHRSQVSRFKGVACFHFAVLNLHSRGVSWRAPSLHDYTTGL